MKEKPSRDVFTGLAGVVGLFVLPPAVFGTSNSAQAFVVAAFVGSALEGGRLAFAVASAVPVALCLAVGYAAGRLFGARGLLLTGFFVLHALGRAAYSDRAHTALEALAWLFLAVPFVLGGSLAGWRVRRARFSSVETDRPDSAGA